MSTKAKKRPNLTMLASERVIEQALDHGEMVYLLIAKEDSAKDQVSERTTPLMVYCLSSKMYFLMTYHQVCLLFATLNIKLVSFQEPHCPIRLPTVVIRRKLSNYRSKLMNL